jgi:hypothetical protein
MSALVDPSQEIVPTGVTFIGEGSLEIAFIEKRDQTDHVGLMKTIFIDVHHTKLAEQYQELIELVTDIIDGGLLALRKPETTLDPRKRFRSPTPVPLAAEDDEEV